MADFENRDVPVTQAQQRTNWSTEYEAVRSRSHLNQTDQIFYAERAKLLLGSYRRNDANDPETYVRAITLRLSEFPRAVAEYVTDPRVGIQSQERFRSFPQNAGEVKEACDAEIARAHRAQQPAPKFRKREYVEPDRYPGCRANVLVVGAAPQYAAIVAWTKLPDTDERDWKWDENGRDGIWVTLTAFNAYGNRSSSISKTWKSPSDAELRESFARLDGARPAEEIYPEGA